MANAWKIKYVEHDTLPGLATAMTTLLTTTWAVDVAAHIRIDDHRGLAKHYSMFTLFWGDNPT